MEGYEPRDAVIAASKLIILKLEQMKMRFESEWELKKISGEGDF